MRRLTAVEVRRLFARRVIIGALIASVLGGVLTGWTLWDSAQPLSPQQQAEGRQLYEERLADWEAFGAEYLAECLELEDLERQRAAAAGDDFFGFGCEDQKPQLEWFIPTPPTFAELVPELILSLGLIIAVTAFLIGTTFTAAELSTGSIGTWLIFEPRRVQVLASKYLAVAVGLTPMAVIIPVATIAALWAGFASQGRSGAMGAYLWSETVGSGLRALILTVAAGLAGAALGVLTRRSAAVFGLVVAYTIVIEAVFAFSNAVAPWRLLLNVQAWIGDGAPYVGNVCTVTPAGTTCDDVERVVSMTQAGGYLGGLVVAVIVLSMLVFRRRDVR